jgi:predicted TPR repeat methyltransferase
MEQFDSPVDDILLPEADSTDLSQDREWCDVVVQGQRHRVRFHDYDQLFRIPGLYEAIFYQRLQCCSPTRVADLLDELTGELGEGTTGLRVLDVGAGNGMVGDELRARDVQCVMGIDIISEAREATQRDRPGVYDDYFVADLTDLAEDHEQRLREARLNCLTCVAALGFGDIPPAAFAKALDLIETPGWLAFTIKEDFLHDHDAGGFAGLVRNLTGRQILQVQAYRRFSHRLSVTGQRLYYVAMIARKMADLPDDILDGVWDRMRA